MKNRFSSSVKRLSFFAIAFFLPLCLSSCFGKDEKPAEPVAALPQSASFSIDTVKLGEFDPKNEHPATLDAAFVTKALTEVAYTLRDRGEYLPVFFSGDVPGIVEKLIVSLVKAEPNEEIEVTYAENTRMRVFVNAEGMLNLKFLAIRGMEQ